MCKELLETISPSVTLTINQIDECAKINGTGVYVIWD